NQPVLRPESGAGGSEEEVGRLHLRLLQPRVADPAQLRYSERASALNNQLERSRVAVETPLLARQPDGVDSVILDRRDDRFADLRQRVRMFVAVDVGQP